MQSARMSVTAVASDKVKHQKLNFYINGRISNFSRIQNVQLSHTDEGGDFIYSLSENMECFIEESQTLVSVEKELKRFQKKMEGFSEKDKLNGFVNCVRGTYDFIYGVSGENEIEFSKDKLFTGFIMTGGRLKAVSTNYNSFYRIRGGAVDNLIEKLEKPAYAVDKPKDADYSPSKGVMKEFETDDIEKGDIFLFATTNVNTRIDEEIIAGFIDRDDNAEELAWKAVNEAGKHSIDDNLIVIGVSLDDLSEHKFLEKVEAAAPLKAVKSAPDTEDPDEKDGKPDMEPVGQDEKKHGFFNAAASIFKSSHKESKETIDTEVDLEETTLVAEEPEPTEEPEERTEDKTLKSKKAGLSFPGLNGDFRKLNVKRPGFMKRRMNIYLKRLLSIVIVLVLMAGIVWGMYHLLKLIFTDKDDTIEFSPTPTAVATPTPVPTPEPTPEPTVAPTPEPTPDQVYMEYEVQPGDTLSKISATFYNGQDKVAEIVAYNENITDPSKIFVGQIIKLPILEGTNPDDSN